MIYNEPELLETLREYQKFFMDEFKLNSFESLKMATEWYWKEYEDDSFCEFKEILEELSERISL